MNVLIDTNVILDAMTSREPFCGPAQDVFMLAADRVFVGFITASSATDIYYLLHRYGRIEDRQLTTDECREKMMSLYELLGVLDVNEADCRNAFELAISDYEDSVLATVAKRHKMAYIVTRNLDDFKNSPVKAIYPKEFISIIEEKA